MLTNQMKIIWRSLLRNKMTSIINLSGWTIGLAAALLIGIFIYNEWQTDRDLPFPEQTYRLLRISSINWSLLAPQFPFNYTFLDESLDQQYLNEERQSRLFQFFALAAILIAGLGMFGLAFFTTVTRSREIGMRKIPDSGIFQIILLLSRDFFLLVLIASLIACPLAWYFMPDWLSDFAYHISIPLWDFLLVVMVSLFLAGLAIAYHCIKAALLNPVEVLKDID